MRVMIGKI